MGQRVHCLWGALVWDWSGMRAMGTVSEPPEPTLLLHGDVNSTFFLGALQVGEEPQLVAVSGASLARTELLTRTNTFAVALYRAVPGLQVQVAVHPGSYPVDAVKVRGGGLDHARFDLTGQVCVVQATATEERITVAVQLERRVVYLPPALKSL